MQVAGCAQVVRSFGGALRAIAAIALSGLAAACAASTPFPPDLRGGDTGPVAEVLADAYRQASENYLYEVKVSDIALAGLSDLSRMYGSLDVAGEGDTVSVKLFNEQLLRFDRPAEMDIDGWARQIAASMIAIANRTGTPPVPPRRLFDLHMEGVAKALGPEVEYVSNEAVWNWLRGMPDSGVGFVGRRTDAGLQVVELDPEGHLEAEGLRLGDIITAVDNADIKRLKPAKLLLRLMGPEGSTVTLSVLRGDPPRPTYLPVTRRKLEPRTNRLIRHGGIAEFDLPSFGVETSNEIWKMLRYEFRKAKFSDQPLTGILIDLRHALGGSSDKATGFAEMFLGSGVKWVERGRDPSSERVWKAGLRDDSEQLPLIVLVGGMTGPAAEIVTAALQDNERAIVIGSSTAGNGVIMKGVSLHNMGFFRMAVARAYAPSGYGIEGRGVMPHICTAKPGLSLEGLLAALRRGEGLIDRTTRTQKIALDDVAAISAYRAACPVEPDPMTFDPRATGAVGGSDLALELGLAILDDPDLYAQLLYQSAGS